MQIAFLLKCQIYTGILMSPAVLDAAEAAHITHLSHVFFNLDWHTESAVQIF